MGNVLSTPEGQMVLLYAVFLLPMPFLAYWGWRYGKSPDSNLVGFLWRSFVAVFFGSWTLGAAAGHGVGIAPLPSLLCGLALLKANRFGCIPDYWFTPVVAAIAFCGMAIIADARRPPRAPRHW
jgi:hypothetical protein